MTKELFEGLGITKKEFREFCSALEKLAKNKTPNQNFAKVDPALRAIQELAKRAEYDIEFEYSELSASIILKFDTVGLFTGETKDLLVDAINKVDSVIVEPDDLEEDIITIMFIIKDIFDL